MFDIFNVFILVEINYAYGCYLSDEFILSAQLQAFNNNNNNNTGRRLLKPIYIQILVIKFPEDE